MQSKDQEIKKWENVEVRRSASEAQRRVKEDLKIKENIITRYSNPPADTPYYLEYSYHVLGDVKDKMVLDYGCGTGDNSVLLANRGAKVIGVDISPDLLKLAEKRLNVHNYSERSEFRLGSAHKLPLEDESVDVVFGIAILHHLELEMASKEVFRVLKKGGRAIFQEPVRNSKLIKFVRNLIPYEQPDLSPFERPLTDKELADFARDFSGYNTRSFSLPFVNLTEVLGLPEKIYDQAVRLDHKLLSSIGFLNYYASVKVIEITK
jgi:SAM-dependent methyltransferase